jgi:hypothetical protein
MDFENKLIMLLKLMKEWFHSNMLSLNSDKTCCMKFSAKQDYINKLYIEYGDKN